MTADVSIVTTGHDVSDARLHRQVAALHRAGLSVEVLGLGDARGGPPGARTTSRPRPGLVGRALLGPRYAWQAQGRVLMALDPDSALAALPIGRARRRRVVADVHEDYAALLRDRAWARGPIGSGARLLVRLARWGVSRADLTVVADEHLPPGTARERLVVRNEPDPAMLPQPTEPGREPRALYVGDVRASRGLWTMVEAAIAAPGWVFDIVGPVSDPDLARARARLESAGAASRVRFHGRLGPIQAWAHASGAWVGLAVLEDTAAFRDAVPSKLYEYLACGLPVVVTDLPRMRAIVQGSGAGVVVPCGRGTAQSVAAVLLDWPASNEQWAARRAAALEAGRGHGRSGYDALAFRLVRWCRP